MCVVPVIAEAVEKWKADREARLAGGGGSDKDVEEEEEEYIYAVQDDEVRHSRRNVRPVSLWKAGCYALCWSLGIDRDARWK